MSAPFIPFRKADAPIANASLASGPTGSLTAAKAFAPLNAVPVTPPTSASAHLACAPTAAPTVTLQRDGDRVTHIRIQCACGQMIELECNY